MYTDSTISVGDYQLELFRAAKTKAKSKNACESRGAWIVEVKNEELNDAVIELIGRYMKR